MKYKLVYEITRDSFVNGCISRMFTEYFSTMRSAKKALACLYDVYARSEITRADIIAVKS